MPQSSRHSTSTDTEDPLTLALKPPKDETPSQREKRVKAEAEALKVSQEIDKEIERERAERKKQKPEIKVLLLGPSGAGKSTTLKNFQLTFTPKALQAEAASYVALVFLNVISSVRVLCDAIHGHGTDAESLSEELRERATRLESLMDLEPSLTRRFQDSVLQPRAYRSSGTNIHEISLKTGDLRGMLQSLRRPENGSRNTEEVEHARKVLMEGIDNIEFLARHPDVRKALAERNMALEHLPGYFLDDLQRITATDYMPTDNDILRTRIRTLGVTEMHFTMESGHEKGQTWNIVDVGGARHQRAAWAPYFDDASAVIFMAPVGHFDQFLEEDSSVNCLQDTLELWKSIISQKLLQKAEIILFLNKYDILEQKLRSGIKFSSFVTSYTGPDDTKSVGQYLQKTFTSIYNRGTPATRAFYSHFTSVTDKSSTVALISHYSDNDAIWIYPYGLSGQRSWKIIYGT